VTNPEAVPAGGARETHNGRGAIHGLPSNYEVAVFLSHSHKREGEQRYERDPKGNWSYLVSLAHHRKPHVAAARQRRPDQLTAQTGTQTLSHTHTHTDFCSGLLTCTGKFKKSQVQRLGVIHPAEGPRLKSRLAAGSVGQQK